MIKTLKLFSKIGKFLDNQEYTIVDNDNLTIKILTEFGANTEIYAIIKNNDIEKHIKIKNKQFEIDKELLKIGKCYLTIIIKSGNLELARYNCVPLIIKQLENKKYVIDEIEVFRNELECLKNDYEALKSNLTNIIKNDIKTLIIAE